MVVHRIRLYVAGDNELSRRAIDNLRHLCDTVVAGRCEYQVVDVLVDAAAAMRDRVIATPMAVRYEPEPVRKVIGDLSDSDRFLDGLGIDRHAADGS